MWEKWEEFEFNATARSRLSLMPVSCLMPAESERQVRQWRNISTWELKQADIDVQHNTTTPAPGEGAFPVGRTQTSISNSKDYNALLHKSHTVAHAFLNYKPM